MAIRFLYAERVRHGFPQRSNLRAPASTLRATQPESRPTSSSHVGTLERFLSTTCVRLTYVKGKRKKKNIQG